MARDVTTFLTWAAEPTLRQGTKWVSGLSYFL